MYSFDKHDDINKSNFVEDVISKETVTDSRNTLESIDRLKYRHSKSHVNDANNKYICA